MVWCDVVWWWWYWWHAGGGCDAVHAQVAQGFSRTCIHVAGHRVSVYAGCPGHHCRLPRFHSCVFIYIHAAGRSVPRHAGCQGFSPAYIIIHVTGHPVPGHASCQCFSPAYPCCRASQQVASVSVLRIWSLSMQIKTTEEVKNERFLISTKTKQCANEFSANVAFNKATNGQFQSYVSCLFPCRMPRFPSYVPMLQSITAGWLPRMSVLRIIRVAG